MQTEQNSCRHLLVGQSGGPTAVINSSLAGIIEEAGLHPESFDKVIGMVNGLAGYLDGDKIDLSLLSTEDRQLLKTTPAAYLGSCRFQLPNNYKDEVYERLFDKFEEDKVGAVLYIGGNDSMDTVDKLTRAGISRGSDICFIGVCKTIDNDLCLTDHTPGYGSAAKYVASAVRQMVLDSEVYKVDSVLIIEIMGRQAGWLTASSALARKFVGDNPALIYLPEVDFDIDDMTRKVKDLLKQRHTVCVCVSEGIRDAGGRLVCEMSRDMHTDTFGHKQLAGCGKVLETEIRNRLGVKVRSVELNTPQRASAVEASLTDVDEAFGCGRKGVELAIAGESGLMVGIRRVSSQPYLIEYTGVPVNQVCNQDRNFPVEWITDGGCNISDRFLTYARPLIQGESRPPFENGLPTFLYRDISHDKL